MIVVRGPNGSRDPLDETLKLIAMTTCIILSSTAISLSLLFGGCNRNANSAQTQCVLRHAEPETPTKDSFVYTKPRVDYRPAYVAITKDQ